MKTLSITILAFCMCPTFSAQNSFAGEATNEIQIESLIVDGKQKPLLHAQTISLGSSPQNVSFEFEERTNFGPAPFRIRYQLEGYDKNWNQGGAWMYLAIRFYNDSGDEISQNMFKVAGDSAGWNGSLKNSPLAH